jgi:hypothetical protein
LRHHQTLASLLAAVGKLVTGAQGVRVVALADHLLRSWPLLRRCSITPSSGGRPVHAQGTRWLLSFMKKEGKEK